MPRLADVCRYVRSKNAGPFWITVDVFFPDRAAYERYVESPVLQAEAIAAQFGIAAAEVKRFPVPELQVLKISYPRRRPQGGAMERDMHGGQQYVRLLELEV
jgi:hypothetical protein